MDGLGFSGILNNLENSVGEISGHGYAACIIVTSVSNSLMSNGCHDVIEYGRGNLIGYINYATSTYSGKKSNRQMRRRRLFFHPASVTQPALYLYPTTPVLIQKITQ